MTPLRPSPERGGVSASDGQSRQRTANGAILDDIRAALHARLASARRAAERSITADNGARRMAHLAMDFKSMCSANSGKVTVQADDHYYLESYQSSPNVARHLTGRRLTDLSYQHLYISCNLVTIFTVRFLINL